MVSRAVDRIDRYADLIVRVGANVQPGQTLFVNAMIEHAELARALTRAAYRAEARYVDVRYQDQHVRRAMIEFASDEMLQHSPSWVLERSRSRRTKGSPEMTAPSIRRLD